MAGFSEGAQAHACFVANLRYATQLAAEHDITILIEPLNHYDAPGYFLTTTTQAREIIAACAVDGRRSEPPDCKIAATDWPYPVCRGAETWTA